MNRHLHFTDRMLLDLLLQQNRTTYNDFVRSMSKKYALGDAKQIGTQRVETKNINQKTNEKFWSDDVLFDSGNYFISTTQYGRIKNIQSKPKTVVQPRVTIKKSRKIQ